MGKGTEISDSLLQNEDRYCVSRREARGFCRWLLLARLPDPLSYAKKQPGILETKNGEKQTARQSNECEASSSRLDCDEILGARDKEFFNSRREDSESNQGKEYRKIGITNE